MTKGLAPLPPDLKFELLADCEESFEFSFAAKKEALGPHIRAHWPWDEDLQRSFHKSRFAEKPFFAIFRCDEAIGTVSWLVESDHARFGEFYLFPRFQNAGLGSRILKNALTEADKLRLPVRLECLKWNPVRSLYLRNGFRPTHESDIHIFLERSPSPGT